MIIYIISYPYFYIRIENVIKHCRIKAEGRYLTVSNLKFQKLETLVEHYRRNGFYKQYKLSHPIGEELFRKSQESNVRNFKVFLKKLFFRI